MALKHYGLALCALAFAGSTALGTVTAHAADKEISWIYCGDKMDPIHEKYIKEWEGKNEGWKVVPEVVGWAQCQDKATTLAAAGTPVAMAYVGSRTLKQFAENDLIEALSREIHQQADFLPRESLVAPRVAREQLARGNRAQARSEGSQLSPGWRTGTGGCRVAHLTLPCRRQAQLR